MKKPKDVPRAMYVLFDSDGECADIFVKKKDAVGCAWGPRFRAGATVVKFERTTETQLPGGEVKP